MPKPKPIKFFQDVLDKAGGSTKLGAALNVHALTVEGWKRRGIPTKYWDKIDKLYNISPAELYFVSNRCRKLAA